MKSRTILSLALFLVFAWGAKAEIEFSEVTTQKEWQQTLKQAGKQGKLIFVDVYTDWCGWCVKMENEVYSKAPVSDYYNEHFINVKINAEKGDGPDIMDNYEIGGYPAYLFVNSAGEAVHSSGGYQEVADFRSLGEGAVMIFEKMPAMEEKFEAGTMELEKMANFASAVASAGNDELLDRVVSRYFEELPKKKRFSQEAFEVFSNKLGDLDGEIFQFVMENQGEYIEAVGDKAFTQAMKGAYVKNLEYIMASRDYEALDKVTEVLTPFLVEKPEDVPLLAFQTKLYVYKELGDWGKFKESMADYSQGQDQQSGVFRDAADLIGRDFNLNDAELLELAMGWAKKAVELEKNFSTLFTRAVMEIRQDELRDALATLGEAENATDDEQEQVQIRKLKQMISGQIPQEEE